MKQQTIELTAKLYRCHDTATRFFKEDWPHKFNDWKKVIDNVMKRDNCKEIEAAITLAEDLKDHSFSLMVMLATVAEMIEPDLRNK